MSKSVAGIHHITGISGPAAENVGFYVRVLGLRLVKKTVNFDDPSTYHLYYGDGSGAPGSIMTFFPWSGAYPGLAGVGAVSHTAFLIRDHSLAFWMDRLSAAGVAFEMPVDRFGDRVLSFRAPDGLFLELVARAGAPAAADWPGSPVAVEHAIGGFHSATLMVRRFEEVERILTDILGFAFEREDGDRRRFVSAATDVGAGRAVDLLSARNGERARSGTGTIHHIAFRAKDEAEQRELREQVVALGLRVTDVLDRNYFKSIYFREPGGILFEIATDPPGFTADEPLETLGAELKLPAWLESDRASIEARLEPLE